MAIPRTYSRFKQRFPDLVGAYESMGEACRAAGPLDGKTTALVKLGIAVGSGLEGATHSAVRKALEAGCTAEECEHAAILSVTTLGFPAMMRARAWVTDVTGSDASAEK